MSIAPIDLTHIDLSELFDERIECKWPECDQEATHRCIHVKCNWGHFLCTEHALYMTNKTWVIGLIGFLGGTCANCGARIKSIRKSYKVVPL